MAERRMFARTIIDSDMFLDMPLSTQALYFHLCMRADDDGFINNPRKIARMIGSTDDDFRVLTAKRFVIPFDSGVVVIKHWKIHNYIQSDRYRPTVYLEERSTLNMKYNKAYTDKVVDTVCIQDVSSLDTQDSLGKASQGKGSLDKSKSSSSRSGDNDDLSKFEDAARKTGLPWYDIHQEGAERLAAEYTADWLIQAIERTAIRDKQNWGTVEAILKNWKKQGYIDKPGAKHTGSDGTTPNWVLPDAQ